MVAPRLPIGHDVRVRLRCEWAPPAPLTPPRATSLCHLGTTERRSGSCINGWQLRPSQAVSMGGRCGLHKLPPHAVCHQPLAYRLRSFSWRFLLLSDLRAACPLHTSVAPLHAGVNSLARRCNPLHDLLAHRCSSLARRCKPCKPPCMPV